MGNPNSKRARRRLRARNEADPDLIYWMGRWLIRTYTEERITLPDGRIIETSNESWNEPIPVNPPPD